MMKKDEKLHLIALAPLLSDGEKTELWIDKTYNSFTIGGRSRKRRKISCPSEELMAAQKKLYEALLVHIAPHPSATAFYPGRNIGDNARSHLGRPFLYKTDISNFFASIRRPLVCNTLETMYPYLSKSAVEEIVELVTYEDALPQGAPTSPHLANLTLIHFDKLLWAVSNRFDACYTRYADDISVSASSHEDLQLIASIVRSGLAELNLDQHQAKTKFLGPKERKLVTGLDVSGTTVRPPRKYRKKVAALVRMSERYNRRATGAHLGRIKGYLAHWESVAPDDDDAKALNERVERLRSMLGKTELNEASDPNPFGFFSLEDNPH